MQKLRVLDLFSGIGGFTLGLGRAGGFETVAFCEIEPFAQKVLAKHWPEIPIHKDIRTLRGEDVGPVDLICGGYPCQPFSTAGERRGKEDDRHLWPEFHRLVDELRPTWVIGENVAGHISMGLDDVLSDLEGSGYACRTFVIPACAVDAQHRRDRVWTVGHAASQRRGETGRDSGRSAQRVAGASAALTSVADTTEAKCKRSRGPRARRPRPTNFCEVLANSNSNSNSNSGEGLQSRQSNPEERAFPGKRQIGSRGDGFRWWPTEPELGRVAHGVPNRAHRLRGLGNAVVPQIPEIIGRAIMEAEHASTIS